MELLETRRQYVINITPCWALPPLLLCATTLDTDASVTRVVVDGWLLIRIGDGTGLRVGGRPECSFVGAVACVRVCVRARARVCA